MKKIVTPLSLIALTGVLLNSCAVGPNYKRPNDKVNKEWIAGENSQLVNDQDPWIDWWKQFQDPTLNALIDRALVNNPDMRMTTAKIQEMRSKYFSSKAIFFPQIEYIEDVERIHLNASYPFVVSMDKYTEHQRNWYGFWEADLFGQYKRISEGTHANFQASVENHRFVTISLIADVAASYINYRLIQQKYITLQRLNEVQLELNKAIDYRSKQGMLPENVVLQAKLSLDGIQYQLSLAEEAKKTALNQLTFLLGEMPGELNETLAAASTLPQVPLNIPVGLPSTLLCRRPDIREAERKMAEASAYIGAAIADLFPKVSLTGLFGKASPNLAHFFNLVDKDVIYGGAVSWPVFQGGKVINNIKITRAKYKEAFWNYQKKVISALHEVENNLISFEAENKRLAILKEELESKQLIQDNLHLRYDQGLASYSDFLKTSSDILMAKNNILESQANLLKDFIFLYKSLGGGWQVQEKNQEEKSCEPSENTSTPIVAAE